MLAPPPPPPAQSPPPPLRLSQRRQTNGQTPRLTPRLWFSCHSSLAVKNRPRRIDRLRLGEVWGAREVGGSLGKSGSAQMTMDDTR